MKNNAETSSNKQTVVQMVKTVAVLVVICLVCCLLLSVCNDLFYISDEDRFQRSMAKIYPDFVNDSSFSGTLDGAFKTYAEYGEIKSVVRSTDGTYILEALGNGGYANGTVTLYVVVGSDALIKSWAVKEHVGQSYINRVPSDAGQRWYVGKNVSDVLALDMEGATVQMTSTAINHAVNMAAYYCRNALGVGKNPEADAKAAVAELLGADFADYNWTSRASVLSCTVDSTRGKVSAILSDDQNTIAFFFTATGAQGDAQVFVYGEDEDLKIVAYTQQGEVLSSNLTGEETFVANIRNNRIVTFTFGSYTAYAMLLGAPVGEVGTLLYTVAGLAVGTTPSTYVLEVNVVTADGVGTVESINVVKTGNYEYPMDQTEKLATSLVGTTLTTIDSVYQSDKVSGATNSANLIAVAVKAALADFQTWLSGSSSLAAAE